MNNRYLLIACLLALAGCASAPTPAPTPEAEKAALQRGVPKSVLLATFGTPTTNVPDDIVDDARRSTPDGGSSLIFRVRKADWSRDSGAPKTGMVHATAPSGESFGTTLGSNENPAITVRFIVVFLDGAEHLVRYKVYEVADPSRL